MQSKTLKNDPIALSAAQNGDVWRKSVESDSERLTVLPREIYRRAEEGLLSIERQLNGLWLPKSSSPIEIPETPSDQFYKFHAAAFAKSYFYKNCFKSLISCNILRYHLCSISNFVDLGAGSGAFSTALHQSINFQSIKLVDRSPNQLRLAGFVISKILMEGRFELVEENIRSFDTVGLNCLSSYALGEAMGEGVNVIEKVCLARSFTIIDSPTFVRLAYPILKECGLRLMAGQIEFRCGSKIEHLVEGGRGHFAYLHSSGPK